MQLKDIGNVFYHGSPKRFSRFDARFLSDKDGIFEHGYGFYFSNDKNVARGYAGRGGYIYTCKLHISRPASLTKSAKPRDIKKLIIKAPHYKEVLENFGENPDEALQMAVTNIVEYSKHEADAFDQVWYDFYHPYENGPLYLRNLSKLGYKGFIKNIHKDTYFSIVYDEGVIEVLNKERVK